MHICKIVNVADHMMKEVTHYMEHDGIIEKPVVVQPPDPDDQPPDEVLKFSHCF